MRFAWTVAQDDPDYYQGDKHGIDGYFFPMADILTTPASVAAAAAHGGGRAIGIYMGHDWYPGYSPTQLAAVANSEYGRVTKDMTVNKQLRVMFNLEQHDPGFIADTLEAFRALRRLVGLSWSPEGMQGGWMGPVFVARLLAARVRVVPQGFWGANGSIKGDWAHDQVLRDLTKRGFPESSVSIFHDGATIDTKRNAEGFVFTMGRLPWLP
jgi:hypothetical protein